MIDRYLGPDATATDRLRVAVAAIGGLLLGVTTVPAPLPERILLGLLSAELCAGLMAALNHAGKAWIHRPQRRALRLLGFLGLQAVVLALFIWFFRDQDLSLLGSAIALLLAGSTAILLAPPDWQRATGFVVLLAGLFLLQRAHLTVDAGAWFLPLFYARTFIAHLPSPRN